MQNEQNPESDEGSITTTVIDQTATATTRRFRKRRAAESWLAEQADTNDRDFKPTIAALITDPPQQPLVLIGQRRQIANIEICTDASGTRWRDRTPKHTVIMRHDGSVEAYDTQKNCEKKNDGATGRIDTTGALNPDNPQTLMIDVGRHGHVLAVTGPGPTTIISLEYWRSVQAGETRYLES